MSAAGGSHAAANVEFGADRSTTPRRRQGCTIVTVTATMENAREEGLRLLAEGVRRRVDVRLIGGVAVAVRCPSTSQPPLSREYKDLDFVARSQSSRLVEELLVESGYTPAKRFNAINGHRRLLFHDEERGRQIDIIFDRFAMCHTIDFRDRMGIDQHTLPLADLLLTKLQIVEINRKDLIDIVALLVDHQISDDSVHGIDGSYISSLTASDWGLWRTLQLNREKVRDFVNDLTWPRAEEALDQITRLYSRIDSAPKNTKWKMRARIGDRVRWYELPEEVG